MAQYGHLPRLQTHSESTLIGPQRRPGVMSRGMALPFPLRPCELELSTSYAQWDFLEQVSGALENFWASSLTPELVSVLLSPLLSDLD